MPTLDPDAIVRSLGAIRSPGSRSERLAGLPAAELHRSPVAAAIGALAGSAELFLFHFEHRRALDTDPDATAQAAEWVDGVLPEPKYGAFRHDLRIGSYHPGHRPAWTAHELCHALVGFGWRPDAPPLFHATAARLAELAPVVVWYFLDEIGLPRCPRHAGPLFRTFCPACERAAADRPLRGAWSIDEDRAHRAAQDAARFVDDELAAVARTLRLGRPAPHVWGSIDLCSDGLAYAASHGPRLRSPAFAAWAERFLAPGDPTSHTTLDNLAERVVAVLRAVAEGAPLGTSSARTSLVAQDLGQRLLDVWGVTEGPCADALLGIVDDLADGATPAATFLAYVDLHDVYDLPDPDDVFAVGYAIDGVPGRSVVQVAEGLATVVPATLEAADDAGMDLVAAFVAADGFARRPLGVRFASWLAAAHPGPIADLARFEATLRAAGGEPEVHALGPGAGARLAEGVAVEAFGVDVETLAERVDAGEVVGTDVDGRLVLAVTAGDPLEPEPTGLVVGRVRGELVIAVVSADDAAALSAGGPLPEHLAGELLAIGLAVPERWDLPDGRIGAHLVGSREQEGR